MFGEPNGLSGGDLLVILAYLAGFPFVASVITGGVAGRMLKGTSFWPGVWAGCGVGVLNPFLAFLVAWMYTERVYDDSFEVTLVWHAVGGRLVAPPLWGCCTCRGGSTSEPRSGGRGGDARYPKLKACLKSLGVHLAEMLERSREGATSRHAP